MTARPAFAASFAGYEFPESAPPAAERACSRADARGPRAARSADPAAVRRRRQSQPAQPVPGLTGVHQETPRFAAAPGRAGPGGRRAQVPAVRRAHARAASATSTGRSPPDRSGRSRQRFGHDIWLATDVCLCSSTPHGHCGVLNAEGDHLDNDASVAELVQAAVAYAQAGADCVAPSDMMDGRIGAIRAAPRRRRPRAHRADELCGQVSLHALRTVSRGGRLGAQGRRRRSRIAPPISSIRRARAMPGCAPSATPPRAPTS